MKPTPQDVAAFVGAEPGETFDQRAATSLDMATAMVKAYVRGNGFTGDVPEDDIAAVIVSCTARLMRNPHGDRQRSDGPFTVSPGTFSGWTLPELAVLHRYRKRAA